MITKNYLYIVFLFFLAACGQKKKLDVDLKIEVREIDKPIILWYNVEHDVVTRVMLPYNVKIFNNTDDDYIIKSVDYLYREKNNSSGGIGGGKLYYKNRKNSYLGVDNFNRLSINKKDSLDYLLYSLHILKEKNVEQQKTLEVYKKQMRAQKKDSMHITKLEEFRKKHPKLTEYFLESDLIRVDYRKENSDKTRRFDTNVLTKEQKEIKLKY
ncbi:hypothetical protein [Aquimarina algicola]|uniref:Uncharacterized protein n=1 Tax=Aquimarina algicola TaxID=2589995 RepID=A0A504J315_9FLAO|nr:hypothetical protein [Aquimarina algicola]TPN82812.1 hypothetical protein FHK87_20510 [Aquimarina algicola]